MNTRQITTLLAASLLSLTQPTKAADAPDTSTWAKFSSFAYSGKSKIIPWGGEYQNPVVAGFYPDPSICRVGDDYYLVNSSFQYFPGLPLWHSKDLVNWTQIANVISRASQYPSKGGQVSAGEYAPTIRYHNGTFYVVCTLVGGPGNFYVTAKDPKGPWSEPVFLNGVGGIDPSFFFDDDGKCYVCSCDEPPQNKPEYNGHRTIRVREIDFNQPTRVANGVRFMDLTSEQTILVNGGTDITKNPVWCEGPHIYKIGKYYYVMAAQGGTSTEHSEVIFRSDKLRGPYLPWDKNPMITAVDLPEGRFYPVTCTGHADLVQTQEGEWFAVFLACTPYDRNFFNTGRQTFMLPVKWENEWPIILPPKTPVPLTVKKPNLPADKPAPVPTTGNIAYSDNFDSDTLGLRWIGLRAPTSDWHATANKALFLEPRADRLSGQGNPSYLAVRQQNDDFTATVTLSAQAKTTNCVAGLAAFQNENHYYAINVTIESGRLTQVSLEQPAGGGGRGRNIQLKTLATEKLPANTTTIDLQITGAGPVTKCAYKVGNGAFAQIGKDLESSFLSTEVAGGFQGVTLGMFARTPDATNSVPQQANP